MREDCTSFAEKLTGLFSEIVMKTLTVQLLRELDELDITLSQLQALTLLAERSKCSVGSLADGLRISHPAAVKLIDKLLKKGLVTRRVGVEDHRQSEIATTAQGRELVNRVREERIQRLLEVLNQMEPEDRHALLHGLQAFVTAALRDKGALDQLCQSCQALLPRECEDFVLISSESLLAASAAREGLS